MKILAIETSCDETAIALVKAGGGLRNPRFQVLKNIVSSQVKIHRPFGGVVPSLAKREHLKNLPVVFEKLRLTSDPKLRIHPNLQKLRSGLPIDLIAVTVGPGLEPALWTGINFARDLAKSLIHADQNQRRSARINQRKSASLIGVNHLEGHLYSFLLSPKKKTGISNDEFRISNVFPAIVLIVSGGHTILVYQKSLTSWKKIGETRDDAAGEAFDKVARLLGLPYPGGPELEKLAQKGNPSGIEFPRPMIHQKNFDFSFSGLKTSVLYYLRGAEPHRQFPRKSALSPRKSALGPDVAASFQEAIIDVLVQKTIRAANEYRVNSVMLSGGVAANKALRKRLQAECRKNQLNFLSAPSKYQTDNAAMIAVAAYINHLQGKKPRKIAPQSRGKHRITAQASLNL